MFDALCSTKKITSKFPLMKVLSIALCRQQGAEQEPTILAGAQDVSSFGFFTRGSVQQFLIFTSKTLLQRAKPGIRETCLHQDYYCHYFVRSDGLGAIMITDKEYPKRVAFCVLADLIGKFSQQFGNQWKSANTDNAFLKPFPLLEEMLRKCQNPEDCDKITRWVGGVFSVVCCCCCCGGGGAVVVTAAVADPTTSEQKKKKNEQQKKYLHLQASRLSKSDSGTPAFCCCFRDSWFLRAFTPIRSFVSFINLLFVFLTSPPSPSPQNTQGDRRDEGSIAPDDRLCPRAWSEAG